VPRLILKCPGCLTMIETGDLCCDRCWRRLPLLLRSRLRVLHTRKNYPKYLAAEMRIRVWLIDHREDS